MIERSFGDTESGDLGLDGCVVADVVAVDPACCNAPSVTHGILTPCCCTCSCTGTGVGTGDRVADAVVSPRPVSNVVVVVVVVVAASAAAAAAAAARVEIEGRARVGGDGCVLEFGV